MFPLATKPFIWIDYGIVSLIFVTTIMGLSRGFSREVMTLLLWVIGFWVSLHFSGYVSEMLQNNITLPKKRLVIAFISLFISTILLGSFIQSQLVIRFKQTYKHTPFMERLGGLVCGMIQGVVITTIIVFLTDLTPLPNKNWWQESSLLPSFQIFVIWLRDHIALQMTNVVYR